MFSIIYLFINLIETKYNKQHAYMSSDWVEKNERMNERMRLIVVVEVIAIKMKLNFLVLYLFIIILNVY
jgi:hypothetical protein